MATYHLGEEIGRGGMGVVYRATQVELGRDVAVKVLHPDASCGEESISRFVREIKALMAVEHEHIIRIYDCGQLDGRWFYAMQLLSGDPLDQLVRSKGALGWRRALRLAGQAAQALAHCHAHGLVHRDIKPQNMMVDDTDHLTLMDFGLARTVGGTALTEAGHVLGTPRYLPPEVIQGEDPSPPGDVYALGISLLEAASGRPAFDAPGLEDLLRTIIRDGPPPLDAVVTDAPPPLVTLVSRMVDRTAGARPLAGEAASEMSRVLARPSGGVRRPIGEESGVRSGSLHRRRVAPTPAATPAEGQDSSPALRYGRLAAVALLVTALGALTAWVVSRPAPRPLAAHTPSAPDPGSVPPPARTTPQAPPGPSRRSRLDPTEVAGLARDLEAMVARVTARKHRIHQIVKGLAMGGLFMDMGEARRESAQLRVDEQADLRIAGRSADRLTRPYSSLGAMPPQELALLARFCAYRVTRWCRIMRAKSMERVFGEADAKGLDSLSDMQVVLIDLNKTTIFEPEGLDHVRRYVEAAIASLGDLALRPAEDDGGGARLLSDVLYVAGSVGGEPWDPARREEISGQLAAFRRALVTLPGPGGHSVGMAALGLLELGLAGPRLQGGAAAVDGLARRIEALATTIPAARRPLAELVLRVRERLPGGAGREPGASGGRDDP